MGTQTDRRPIVSRDERVLLHDISRTKRRGHVSSTQRSLSLWRFCVAEGRKWDACPRPSAPRTRTRRRRLLHRYAHGCTFICQNNNASCLRCAQWDLLPPPCFITLGSTRLIPAARFQPYHFCDVGKTGYWGTSSRCDGVQTHHWHHKRRLFLNLTVYQIWTHTAAWVVCVRNVCVCVWECFGVFFKVKPKLCVKSEICFQTSSVSLHYILVGSFQS